MMLPWSEEEESRLTEKEMIARLVQTGDYDLEAAQYIVDSILGNLPEDEIVD